MARNTSRDHQLIAYNIWANQRIMDQVQDLSEEEFVRELGGSFPSIQKTIRHLLESDWIWMNRWQNKPLAAVPQEWNTGTAASVSLIWSDVQAGISASMQSFSAADFASDIQFRTKRGDMYSMPLWQTICHMVNHGTYHRGQISGMIRMLGHKPVPTDLFIFFVEDHTNLL